MSRYKAIQLTNTNIPAMSAGSYLPLGTITRRINAPTDYGSVFQVTSKSADTIFISEPGYYKVTYSGTFTAAAAGVLGITLVVNEVNTYTISEEVAAAEDVVNLTLSYIIRVCPNICTAPYNCPTSVQFLLGDVATGVTSNPSTSNVIVERVY